MPTKKKSKSAGLKIAMINQNGMSNDIMGQRRMPLTGGKRDRSAPARIYDGYFSIRGGFCLSAGAVNMPTPSTSNNMSTGLTTENIIQKGNESTVMGQHARESARGNHYQSLQVLRAQPPLFTPRMVGAETVFFSCAIDREGTLYVIF